MISKKYYQELLSDNPLKADKTKTIEDYFNYIEKQVCINTAFIVRSRFINISNIQSYNNFLLKFKNQRNKNNVLCVESKPVNFKLNYCKKIIHNKQFYTYFIKL